MQTVRGQNALLSLSALFYPCGTQLLLMQQVTMERLRRNSLIWQMLR